jgi:hypothetical protein
VTNCLINSTEQNLLFFYEMPSSSEAVQISDRYLMVSEPIELMTEGTDGRSKNKKVHMLSRCKQVFAKVEGSSEISNVISTYAPGTRDKF